MEDLRAQQVEALQVAVPYCEKISTAMNKVVVELEGEKLPDTDEYLDHILKGLNWIIQVYNGTKDLVNGNGQIISKDDVNDSVAALNEASKNKDDQKKAEAIKSLAAFVDQFRAEAQKVIAE